jgi:hypothetical protein
VQIGGDTFSEILIFHDKPSLKKFKQGEMAFAANASAVLVKAAAAGTNNFKGVTAHAYSSGGMLLELSLGGQKFKFKPLGEGDDKGGSKGAKSKGGNREDEDEQESEGEEGDESSGGILSRAFDGIKGAASSVGDIAKERPIAATVVGAGLVTGLAFLVMRALRQRDDQDEDDSQDDEEDDTDARASDESEEEESDEDDESEADSEEDEEDEESSNNHVGAGGGHRRRFR